MLPGPWSLPLLNAEQEARQWEVWRRPQEGERKESDSAALAFSSVKHTAEESSLPARSQSTTQAVQPNQQADSILVSGRVSARYLWNKINPLNLILKIWSQGNKEIHRKSTEKIVDLA